MDVNGNMSVYLICYHSVNQMGGLGLDHRTEFRRIVNAARFRNASAGITGALLYNECRFCGALEGRQEVVDSAFHSVHQDQRHRDVRILFRGHTAQRTFTEWSAAYIGYCQAIGAYYWEQDRQRGFTFENGTLQRMMLRMIDSDWQPQALATRSGRA